MKQIQFFLLLTVLIFTAAALPYGTKNAGAASAAQEQSPPSIASTVDRQINTIEKLIVEAVEAMPEDKFNFSPESLNIPGDDYKGVRTFALQAKHIAASNYALWSPLTGGKFPDDFIGGNGPASLKSKADIIKFLKDSFALGHKAAATLTAHNLCKSRKAASRRDSTGLSLGSPTRSIITARWWTTCA